MVSFDITQRDDEREIQAITECTHHRYISTRRHYETARENDVKLFHNKSMRVTRKATSTENDVEWVRQCHSVCFWSF